MSKKLKAASAVAIAASTMTVLMTGDMGYAYDQMVAAAQAQETVEIEVVEETQAEATEAEVVFVDGEVVQPLPEEAETVEADNAEPVQASSLRELVAMQDLSGGMDEQMRCLAGAVYFESKGESLRGQLAVAHVVKARAESSRFPDSYCGVVYQRSQFSFVRGGKMPRIRTGSKAWANARAIAQIAHNDNWDSDVEGALFFHARYVNPRWRLTRIAQIDNHIFYR